ncbi:Tfp pilus assembly protein FimT/FimU [Psychrobacter immobilis]|uniref:pilus assembly FimT family protein n=1 Tax=Psychrobacter immobilis TaxID=498 RepID=UPI00191A595F|nr:prepilin-type N-terminal cleavage/methylation domain-containing protein [Psychrobacter immobilis]
MNASTNKVAQKLQMTSSGFTLIELMVTIAVLAIIVSIAAPSISTQLAQNQVKSTSTVVQTSIARAKSESAITRNTIVWEYDDTNDLITLVNNGTTIASYNLSSNSSLTFNPATVTTLSISKEGHITTPTGGAVNLAIDIGDTRAGATTQRVRVNTKRAFECSGTNC